MSLSLRAITLDVFSDTRPNNYHVWYSSELELEIDVKVTSQSHLALLPSFFPSYLQLKALMLKSKPLVIGDLLSYVFDESTLWPFLLNLFLCNVRYLVRAGGYSVLILNGLGIGASGSGRWLIDLIWDSTHAVFERLFWRKSLRWNWGECAVKMEVKKVQ